MANPLADFRRLLGGAGPGLAYGEVEAAPAPGALRVRLEAGALRTAYGQAEVGDTVILRGDRVLAVLSPSDEIVIHI